MQNLIYGTLLLALISTSVWSETICNVKDFGAVGDGKTKDTEAIQAAVDQCAQSGGKVLLENGKFKSGTIYLKSNITFHIAINATLRGSKKNSDYPELTIDSDNAELRDLKRALLHANDVENLTIEGRGMIDGRGGKVQWNIPWITESKRPMAIFIAQSKNVVIQDLRVEDAAMWGVVTLETDNLTIKGLNIYSPYLPNRDGIDIVDGHNILIENNTVYSQDDSICFKSGSKHGIKDVIVRHNTILGSKYANGFKLGTASFGSFKNMLFEKNTVLDVNLAALTVESIDGAIIENIVFKDIFIKNTGTPFFVLLGSRKHRVTGERTLPVGSIDGVHFINIRSEKTKKSWGSPIAGSVFQGVRYAPKNITFKGVEVKYKGDRRLKRIPKRPKEYKGQYPDPHMWGKLPAAGIYFRHIDGLKIEDSVFKISNDDDPRPLIVKDDVQEN
ncbi:MAG: hypothetical protein CME62_05555 [Halobacteriovoraceae bacterium]|nr:hypothetical protein [Halobacteriovoraceae bacterium]|tara:strand:+ start:11573 stop:12907 length:1335 start_codon:yes stop_codon:yes gene_type:complete